MFIVSVGLEVRLNANSLIQMAYEKCVCARVSWLECLARAICTLFEKCVNFPFYSIQCCLCSDTCRRRTLSRHAFYDNSHFQRPPATATRSTRMVSATGLTHSPIHFDVLWCLNEKQRIVAFSISMKMQLCHLGNGCVVCDSHLMWWRGEHTKENRNALIHSLALTKSHISHTRLVQIRVFGIASHSCAGVCVCVSAGNNVCLVAFVSQCN